MMNKSTFLLIGILLLIISGVYAQGSFIVGNITNTSKAYLIVNGTSAKIGVGTSALDSIFKVNGSINITDTVWANGINLSTLGGGSGTTFNRANVTEYLGGASINASLLKVNNISGLLQTVESVFNLNNLTNFLGGNNGTIVRFGNISGYDTSTADEFTKANYSSEYSSTGYDRENVSEYLGGSSVNASILKVGNISGLLLTVSLNDSIALWNKSGVNIFLREITGNVGIGTTAPGQALHVIGSVNISSSMNVPVINTTRLDQNITISSGGGSVIIRLR